MHIILTLGLLWAGGAAPSNQAKMLERFEAVEPHMGTKFIIVLYAPDRQAANEGFRAAFSRIAELDRKLSDYNPDSEISRLVKDHPVGKPITVSKDLLTVLVAAQAVSRWSGGAFDVTVGPLTKLWRRARRQHRLPSPQRLARAKQAVGWQKLKIDVAHRTVRLTVPNMRLDLGGIAKGYAVDQALHTLRCHHIDRALVNASGDLAATGAPPGRRGWRVAIAPLKPNQPPTEFGLLANRAIATSGDAYQYVEINGKRYSHIVDPHTGLGLERRSSVSVLAPDCTTADALASACSVLPPADALCRIEQRPDTELEIVYRQSERLVTRMTRGFRQWLSQH